MADEQINLTSLVLPTTPEDLKTRYNECNYPRTSAVGRSRVVSGSSVNLMGRWQTMNWPD